MPSELAKRVSEKLNDLVDEETKRKLVLTSAALVVVGTLLLWVSATSIILAQ